MLNCLNLTDRTHLKYDKVGTIVLPAASFGRTLAMEMLRKSRSFSGPVKDRHSLIPRLSCVGGAWYTLFAHAQFSQDFWEFGNFP